MDKIIGEGLLVISLFVGAGFGLKSMHDGMRKLAVEALMKPSPSLSAYTQKLTYKK